MADNPEKPRICFFTTKGEVTYVGQDRYEDPGIIAPELDRIANIEVVRLEGHSEESVAQEIHPRLEDYDGFVVTTEKFRIRRMAPYLAFAFGPSLNRTIAVTGNNILASEYHSGARISLIRAAMVASIPFNQVAISFGDTIAGGTNFQIQHKGGGLVSYDSYVSNDLLGEFMAEGIVSPCLRVMPRIKESRLLNRFASGIASCDVIPGTEPSFVEKMLGQNPSGLVLTFDGRAIPGEGAGEYSFMPLVREFVSRDIPVLIVHNIVNTGIGETTGTVYEEEREAERNGVILAVHLEQFIATTKFSWAIRKTVDEIEAGSSINKVSRVKELMLAPYVGEFGTRKPFNLV